MNGSQGKDTLIGGDGNDKLVGGSGNDSLISGSGNDNFLYNTNAAFTASTVGLDTLFDFSSTDRITLDKTTFTALASVAGPGFSVASGFGIVSTVAAVATSAACIVYNTSNGGLYYNSNGSATGLGTGAQFASLLGAPSMSAASFVIQA